MLINVKNIDKHTISVDVLAEKSKIDPYIQKAYLKNNKNICIPGFRKGKAPKNIVEKYYGKNIFYAEAINALLPELYNEVLKEKNIEPASKPNFNIKTIDNKKGLELEIIITIKPTFELCQYKDYTFEFKDLPVTEEQINDNIQDILEKNSFFETKNKLIEDRDMVNIDFTGYINGELLDGGEAIGYDLLIGSNQFIGGFESNLLNHSINDEFQFNIIFPENYHKEDLCNKEVTFRVKINDVKTKVFPEFTNDFVQKVTKCNSKEEFISGVNDILKEKNNEKAKNNFLNEIYIKILENVEIDIPQIMIDDYINVAIKEFERSLQVNNITLQQYLEFNNVTLENIKEKMNPNVIINVKRDLIVEKIAKNESIIITNVEFSEKIKEIINNYKDTLNQDQINELRKNMLIDKVSNYLYDLFINKEV